MTDSPYFQDSHWRAYMADFTVKDISTGKVVWQGEAEGIPIAEEKSGLPRGRAAVYFTKPESGTVASEVANSIIEEESENMAKKASESAGQQASGIATSKRTRDMGYCIVKGTVADGTVTFYPDKAARDAALMDIVIAAMPTASPEEKTRPGLDNVTVLRGAKVVKVQFRPKFPEE